VTPTTNEWDELYRVLSNTRRRRVLECLYRRNCTVGSAELGDVVHECERDRSDDPTGVRAVRYSLELVHLPALDNAGLVQWNGDRGDVRLTEKARRLPLFTPVQSGLIDIARPETEAVGGGAGERPRRGSRSENG
jgi:hypothetical protein